MHVLVAPDRMATCSATQVAAAIAAGWLRYDGDATVDVVPLSADGPGSLQDVVDEAGLVQRATGVDLVLTAESIFDPGSLVDRVPRGVAWAAQRAGVPCVVLAGRVLVGRRECAGAGVDAAYELAPPGPAGDDLAERLATAAERVARTWTAGGR
jgi:glycerate 2-kinase